MAIKQTYYAPTDLKYYYSQNETLPRSLIKVVNNVYDLNPENLEDDYGVNRAEEWLFYTPRDRENEIENIRNGAAVDGYWQVIGDDETIVDNDETLGFRKTLEFYKGNPPRGDKTSWIMHEIRANEDQQSVADDTKLDDWIVCRIYHEENRWKDETCRSEAEDDQWFDDLGDIIIYHEENRWKDETWQSDADDDQWFDDLGDLM
ncbi:unnamed protein product [Fraxinus pennsylvanica]|uniref:NAC domain-containing protein n=1 Tax=Fraxinus pennsylvanica TaxID=56036 RepID=A0AAD2A178_9LAMI|nr:unnamed protein product [Fraxinus pennsylvanica]